MHVVIAGSSGFLGSHLSQELRDRGHDVTRLVRRPPAGKDERRWDPYAGPLGPEVLHGVDVVVNLAGSPTAGNPHSKKWARELRESRVTTTRALAEAIAATDVPPPAFLAANAVGWYGDHGTDPVTEESGQRGDSFMSQVCRDWQAATTPASAAGARVCLLRTAPVIDRSVAPLKQMLPAFKLGLGTRLGEGHQYFPIVSLRDWVAAAAHLAEHTTAGGPFNLACPITPTNREYTDALAGAVGRRARVAAPAAVLKVAAGRLAPELLGSYRVVPAALEESGFSFRDRDVRDVIAAALG